MVKQSKRTPAAVLENVLIDVSSHSARSWNQNGRPDKMMVHPCTVRNKNVKSNRRLLGADQHIHSVWEARGLDDHGFRAREFR